jgi:hypothetical protein
MAVSPGPLLGRSRLYRRWFNDGLSRNRAIWEICFSTEQKVRKKPCSSFKFVFRSSYRAITSEKVNARACNAILSEQAQKYLDGRYDHDDDKRARQSIFENHRGRNFGLTRCR